MRYNMNDMATVRLTEGGFERYRAWYLNTYGSRLGAHGRLDGNVLRAELWYVMSIFGSEFYMGNTALPFFENNEIEIESSR